jgi:hypothetical protein
LAALAGLMFALDSKPDGTSAVESTRMLIGSGLGAAIAIGIMVLSLRIVTRMTIG